MEPMTPIDYAKICAHNAQSNYLKTLKTKQLEAMGPESKGLNHYAAGTLQEIYFYLDQEKEPQGAGEYGGSPRFSFSFSSPSFVPQPTLVSDLHCRGSTARTDTLNSPFD